MCAACRHELPWLGAAACPRCALPGASDAVCGRCLHTPPAFDATRALFIYAFPVDRLVQAVKYRQSLTVSAYLATLLARAVPDGVDLIVPMPMHPGRLRARGFNQALELARLPALATGAKLAPALVARTRIVAQQAGLDWKARRRNVARSFSCEAELAGRNVLVIDDVMTSGASLGELACTLKAAGAQRVDNLVVARTPAPGSAHS